MGPRGAEGIRNGCENTLRPASLRFFQSRFPFIYVYVYKKNNKVQGQNGSGSGGTFPVGLRTVCYYLSMTRKQSKPHTRPPFKGDFPAPETDLESLSPYKRRHLPWRHMPAHSTADAQVFISGDGTYHATLHMMNGALWVKAYRLRSDREGTHIFHGSRQMLNALGRKLTEDRIVMLFRTFADTRELCILHHAYHGEHNDFCPDKCHLHATIITQEEADKRQDALWDNHAKQWER